MRRSYSDTGLSHKQEIAALYIGKLKHHVYAYCKLCSAEIRIMFEDLCTTLDVYKTQKLRV
jgi:hypothetical protein